MCFRSESQTSPASAETVSSTWKNSISYTSFYLRIW